MSQRFCQMLGVFLVLNLVIVTTADAQRGRGGDRGGGRGGGRGLAQQMTPEQVQQGVQQGVQQFDIDSLVTLVDSVANEADPQPVLEVSIEWVLNDELRAGPDEAQVLITLAVDSVPIETSDVGLYIRAVPANAQVVSINEFNVVGMQVGLSGDLEQDDDQTYEQVVAIIGWPGELGTEAGGTRIYTWQNPDGSSMSATFDDDNFIAKTQFGLGSYTWDRFEYTTLPTNGQLMRRMFLPAGEYDVFVAVRPRTTEEGIADGVRDALSDALRRQPRDQRTLVQRLPPLIRELAAANAVGAPVGVVRTALSVPAYEADSLSTSSIIRFSDLEQGLVVTDEMFDENPYIFGTNRFVRQIETEYAQTGDIAFIFWVYGVDVDETGMPDTLVEFMFNQVTDSGPEPFRPMTPVEFTSANMPAGFPVGDGLFVFNGALLESFAPGDYQLEITVNDRAANETLVKRVSIAVAADETEGEAEDGAENETPQ